MRMRVLGGPRCDGTHSQRRCNGARVQEDGRTTSTSGRWGSMSTIDEEKLSAYMGNLGLYMTGGAMCFAIWLGDELGLYRAMSDGGAMTADEVAGKAGCNARLVREWLDGQVAAGLVDRQ